MDDGLGEQIVELSIVTALRGGCIYLEQRFGCGTAHGLIGHSHRSQDTRARGGVLSIERTGKMNAAPRCGAFDSDHTVAHDAQGIYCDVLVTTFRHLNGADQFVRYSDKGRHCAVPFIFFQIPALPCGRKRVVNVTAPFGPYRFESGARRSHRKDVGISEIPSSDASVWM